MLDIIKKSANILRNNMIFIQPLILCFLLLILFTSFFLTKNIYLMGKICFCLTIILMIIVFTAGWLYINKLAILSYDENDTKEDIANKALIGLNKFFEGIGINFSKTVGVYLILFFFMTIILGIVGKILLLTVGEPKLIQEFPKLLQATSQAEILNFLNNIPEVDKLTFAIWMMVLNFVIFICNFFSLLYFAVVNFEQDNILISLWKTIKFFFKNIINSIVIMLFIFVLSFGVNFVSIFLGNSTISLMILTILLALYLNYSVLLVFCFYEEKTKNYSNSRTEFVG